MKESLLKMLAGNHSPDLKGAAAWLAGRVTTIQQAGAGSVKAAVPERQDTEALYSPDMDLQSNISSSFSPSGV